MNDKKAPAPGRLHRRAGKYCEHDNSSSGFPICKLYNSTIVDRFPGGCPFAATNVATALLELKNRAWSHLGSEDAACSEGPHELACYDVCYACVTKNLAHPLVHRLRLAAQTPVEPETTGAGSERNGKQRKGRVRSPVYV